MAAHLGLIAHAAQGHPHEVAPRRLGDRLAKRGLAHAGGADQAQDGAADLLRPGLHRQVFDDPLLHLFQPVVVGIEHGFRLHDVVADDGLLLPGDGQDPVEVVAHHRRLGRHRAHGAQLLQLAQGLLPRLLAQLGGVDARLKLGGLVLAVLALAQLLLDRLQLLVQVVFALRLLHLPLHAVADALLHLQHAHLALHVGEDALEPLGHAIGLQQFLLLGDLDGKVRGDRVRQLARILDLVDRDEHLRRDLLVELDIALELRDDGAHQRLHLALLGLRLLDHLGEGLEMGLRLLEAGDAGALSALHQHLHRAVGQLQQLQHGGDGADLIQVLRARVVLRGILLRDQQDLLVVLHHRFQGTHGFLAPHKQRHDHVRKDDDVPQRQHGQQLAADGFRHGDLSGDSRPAGARDRHAPHGHGFTFTIWSCTALDSRAAHITRRSARPASRCR